jgi:hypothetical protein
MAASLRERAWAMRGMVVLLAGMGILGCRGSSTLPADLHDSPLVTGEPYPLVEKPVNDVLATIGHPHGGLHAGCPPVQALVLTGGVSGAPYAGGFLVGWTQSGHRPTFDVVTGISSGALIGVYAYLGPKYDAKLQRVLLTLTTSDLISMHPVCNLVKNGSMGSSRPAERLIRDEVNACTIEDIRMAHAQGRRFFVGTLHMQTKRLVVWDVGALASSGRPDADEVVRKVLLAAFSWPGLVPPVAIDVEADGQIRREEHCDGGSGAMAFLRFGALPGWPDPNTLAPPGWLAGSNLYVLVCRKLYSEPAEVKRRAMVRAKTAINAMFESLSREDLTKLHTFCATSGMKYHIAALPQDYQGASPGAGELYPKDAPRLFELGYQRALHDPAWRHTPPGVEPGEEEIPRSGLHVTNGP